MRLLRLKEVIHRTGLAKSSLYAAMKTGEFPRPVRLTQRTIAWQDSVIDDWIEKRISDSGLVPAQKSD